MPRKHASPGRTERGAIENARLARITGAEPAEFVAAALASLGPSTVAEAIAQLRRLAPALQKVETEDVRDLRRRGARLEKRIVFEPELAAIRRDLRDHEIRGKLLFRDILGRRSFFQVAAWSIAGLDLSARDARLLEQLGVNTQLLAPQIWPLAVARRIAARGGPLGRSVIGASAATFTPHITVEPVASFMRFLDDVDRAARRGLTVEAFIDKELARGRRVSGFGRPVLGPDERVPHAIRLAKRHGRGGGRSVRLAREVERVLLDRKGLVINSAGFQGAVMRDMGFAPDAAAAFCAIYFLVPLVAHHVFVRERLPTRKKSRLA